MKEFDSRDPQLSDLRTLLALLEEGTVTSAARRLGVTQSALSYQLDRMRWRFTDPLFIRVGNRMAPTPFAERLAEPAARVMRIVDTEIPGLAAFDPLTTEREFRIGLNEIGAITFLPRLAQRMASLAPRAQLTPVHVDVGSIESALDSGEMDLAVGHFPQPSALLLQQLLFERDYVCIARRDHPSIGSSMMLQEFSSTPRIETPASPVTRAWVDKELHQHNLKGTIRMSTQHVAAIPFIIAVCNDIAIIPREVFDLFGPIAAIKAVKLPFNIPPIMIHQYWHPRVNSDPTARFFRETVYAIARTGATT